MNHTTPLSSLPPAPSLPAASTVDALLARFGHRVAARLTERGARLEPDLAERLRFAREKALERAREVRRAETVRAAGRIGTTRGGAAVLGGGPRWWVRAASVMPAFALAAGLLLIQRAQDNAQIATAAEVDAALLADDLPPQAYSDAGFAEFLKSNDE